MIEKAKELRKILKLVYEHGVRAEKLDLGGNYVPEHTLSIDESEFLIKTLYNPLWLTKEINNQDNKKKEINCCKACGIAISNSLYNGLCKTCYKDLNE